MNFLEEVITKYAKIEIPDKFKSISKIDSNILWYLADDMETIIHCYSNMLEIDISSAFPSICKVYIKDDNFNRTVDSIEKKENKLIYIANNLDGQQLRNLGYLSKTIIFGKIFENCNKDIDIFEIKKDSCVLSTTCDIEKVDGEFSKFINDSGIKFSIKKYSKYLRYKKTSYYVLDNELIVKGTYKYISKKLYECIKEFLINNDFSCIKDLNKEYSELWFKILRVNNIKKQLDLLFDCGGKCLNSNFKYIDYTRKNINEIDPKVYLKIFIFPFVIAHKNCKL